jgi:hypothetical protein
LSARLILDSRATTTERAFRRMVSIHAFNVDGRKSDAFIFPATNKNEFMA